MRGSQYHPKPLDGTPSIPLHATAPHPTRAHHVLSHPTDCSHPIAPSHLNAFPSMLAIDPPTINPPAPPNSPSSSIQSHVPHFLCAHLHEIFPHCENSAAHFMCARDRVHRVLFAVVQRASVEDLVVRRGGGAVRARRGEEGDTEMAILFQLSISRHLHPTLHVAISIYPHYM